MSLVMGCGPNAFGFASISELQPNPIHFPFQETSFDFGPDLVGSSVVKKVTRVTNITKREMKVEANLFGDSSFTIVTGFHGLCGSVIAPGASCEIAVQYLPLATKAQKNEALLFVATNHLKELVAVVSLNGESQPLSPGDVGPTANPQVAQYTLTLPFKGTWSVRFEPTTEYGRSTGVQAATTAGTATKLYVAGMLPNTTYHMQAEVVLKNGVVAKDVDHTFTTGALPAGIPNVLPVTRTAGVTPQPGVELVNSLVGAIPTTAFVTDLDGNVIWTYPLSGGVAPAELYPVRLLPNGHFLSMIAPVYPRPPTEGVLNVIREFDLAGNTVQQLSMDELKARLVGHGFSVKLSAFSHDIVVLPNGHYLVIVNAIKAFTDLPGFPGVTQVGGDVVVDLNSDMQPVWLWNSFDHLDVNRHPLSFPDWTHANSVAYSKDDGNFIVSLRHQNWVVKVDYRDGAGTGNIVWRLGQGGDFKLVDGSDPTDWFYAQHYAEFASTNTAGAFSLTLFDNGNDRMSPDQTMCGGSLPGQTPCLYSTVQELQVDETAKTAKFQFHQILPASLYSSFAGDTQVLANGNFEYNLAGVGQSAYAFEVVPGVAVGDTPQIAWEMEFPGTNTYRAVRLPSLYPGVQW